MYSCPFISLSGAFSSSGGGAEGAVGHQTVHPGGSGRARHGRSGELVLSEGTIQ